MLSEDLAFVSGSETNTLAERIPISGAFREGRRRDKDTWQYALDNEPDLFAGRGFTAHEYLPWFKLINMNGRLYDPLTGRFLSPDENVQMPDFTQNFNRYSYALNNPLKYTDPDGEFIHLIIGAAIGGFFNWITHGAKFTAEGLKYFGIGAAAGALGAGIGSGISAAMAGQSFGAGFMMTNASLEMTTGFTAGAISGAGGGFTGGFVTEFSNSLLMEGQSFVSSITDAWGTGWKSAVGGAIVGGVLGGTDANSHNRDFWTGQPKGIEKIKIRLYDNGVADVCDNNKFNKEILETNIDINNNTNPLIKIEPGDFGENIVTINAPKGIKSYTAYLGPDSGGLMNNSIIESGKAIQFTTYRTNFMVRILGTRKLYMSINKGWRLNYLFGVRRLYP